MDYQRAVAVYRERARDDFEWPDSNMSELRYGVWHLRDGGGVSLALVAKNGQVLMNRLGDDAPESTNTFTRRKHVTF
jgi:hypothetical protein